MARVAIVTDTASDLSPALAAGAGVTLVPLLVRFGELELRSGTEMSIETFYERLLAPGAPFPTTAACAPGDFVAAFRGRLDEGADAVVCLTVGGGLSATVKAATVARESMPGAPVHVVDTETVTLAQGLLVLMAAEAAAAGEPAAAIVELIERRRRDAGLFVMLDTLEYLRRGGRIGAAQAAIGSVLSVKPIITVAGGKVETIDRPRTVSRARARLLELASEQPIERLAIVHSLAPGVDAFADELADRSGIRRSSVITELIGPSVAPHAGPGAFGAALIARAG